MGRIHHTIYEIYEIDRLADRNLMINQVHPLAKMIVTAIYIGIVVSFPKYDLTGLALFLFYPLLLCRIGELSFGKCLKKLRVILPFICIIGVVNPFFDHTPIILIGRISAWGGVISMLTLMGKGVLALCASFLLAATTGMERICYGLRALHIPGILVTQILLTYRYITVLLEEAQHVIESYSLRAPGEKGVRFKVWGSLAGQLLLRSIDRAGQLYDSMVMRGFQQQFAYVKVEKWNRMDSLYTGIWLFMIAGVRLIAQGFL